ncbi:MAG: thiamine diphosphokinase [Lachnospiraceae bacterium]
MTNERIFMNTLIITGGKLSESFLSAFLKHREYDYVIAVDGAIQWLEVCHMTPNILVGDFDTASETAMKEIAEKFRASVERHRPEKDETDTELAIRHAIKQGARCIDIVGATGRRIDHFLGVLSTLLQPLEEQIDCYLYDEYNKISLIAGTKKFTKKNIWGTYISFLPFTEQVTGINLKGFRYPLENGTMILGNTLGISNELAADEATVEMKQGILICVESDDIAYQDRLCR